MGSGKGQQKRVNSSLAEESAHAPNGMETKYEVGEFTVEIVRSIARGTAEYAANSENVILSGLLKANEEQKWDFMHAGLHLPKGRSLFIYFKDIDKLFMAAEKWAIGELYPNLYLEGSPNAYIYWSIDNGNAILTKSFDLPDPNEEIIGSIPINEFLEMSRAIISIKETIANLRTTENLRQKPLKHDISF